VQELKKLVMAFKDTMPVVEALSNEKLTTDHWEQIKRELEIPDFPL
jgi:dynein heavy chain, axonemal